MARLHGSFIWYELMTEDADAAAAFYGDVVGWRTEAIHDGTGAESGYRLWADDSGNAGGLLPITAEMRGAGAQARWLGYVGVDDVDAAVAAVTAAGGSVRMPAEDMGDVGRIAMVTDPWHAPFYLMKPARQEGESRVFDAQAIGRCAWNELTTNDRDGAIDFYGGLFGWRRDGAMPMGDMGDYVFIAGDQGQLGAVMGPFEGSPPRWRFYFRVADIDAAAERVTAGGGSIIHGPTEVPGGDLIVIGLDPQGVEFAVVGKRRGPAA